MLHVTSEVGRLRRVLMHEPGPEVDRMVPAMMEELLFDDILFGERARDEHRRFRRLLQVLGVEVVEARDLLVETLAEPEARRWLWDILRPELPAEVPEDGASAAAVLVDGRLRDVTEGVEVDDLFAVAPLPNWCFQRDPQVVLGRGVVHSAMATPARWREGLLSRAVFRFHPELRAAEVVADPLAPATDRNRFLEFHRPRLEGGDVLVVSPDLVAVGVSERTNHAGVEELASALARRDGRARWLIMVELPRRRAYMHLDTVLTPADRDAALVFPPVITGTGGEAARTWELDLHLDDPRPREAGGVLEAFARHGVDLEPIPCGGDDPVAQQREQWTDGANTLALAPGVITLYDRNVATAEALDRHGFEVVHAEDVLLGRAEVDPAAGRRTCILLASTEIARARGGPHCLTHPLVREEG